MSRIDSNPSDPAAQSDKASRPASRRRLRILAIVFLLLAVIATAAFFLGRRFIANAMRESLPQLDGTLTLYGLTAPVTVNRDAHGVPHIHAASIDDLVLAQGYVTAQDRLWQMDMLRRHAAGQLAEILGRAYLAHDRLQRTLQLRTAADRAVTALPADQLHWLVLYARGVNASIIAQQDRLPIEFRLLGYRPAPWTARDSLLVELAMFQDLTTSFPEKLGREALTAHLTPSQIADLYPVGSWRDHWPGQPTPDVTAPQPDIPDIPLDESQSRMKMPDSGPAPPSPGAPSIASRWVGRNKLAQPAAMPAASPGAPSIGSRWVGSNKPAAELPASDLLTLTRTLALFHQPCNSCIAGSNAWAVSGSRTASGKPILSNDMHLALTVPELWYEADLDAANPAPLADFHAAGVTIPGTPFVIAGHNDHVAWGFTNLGADVQDLYIEHTRGTPSGAEYQTPGGQWQPVRYRTEIIHVRGASDVILDVPLTRHGDTDTPIVSSIFPGEQRSISLRWTIYDPANVTAPFLAIDSAADWASMLSAISTWGGPPQNLIYADDQGHIGYHAVGRIPVRGDANNPSPLSPVPTDATAPDAAMHEWAGCIPFDQLPQALDPADGILVTANARVTPDGYRFPITLNWMAPYRTERIYKVLEAAAAPAPQPPGAKPAAPAVAPAPPAAPAHPLAPADMLALQTDVFSTFDQVIAQRLAYSIDHATGPLKDDKTLHQAADLLRNWNGNVDANAAASAIVNAARAAFWPMLLIPKLAPQLAPQLAAGQDLSTIKTISPDVAQAASLWQAYVWGEKDSVEEEMVTHTPARWLPAGFATWEDFLAAVVKRGLHDAHAPADLTTWQQGKANPLDLEHPIFNSKSPVHYLIALPTGTGPRPQSGDMTTIAVAARTFGATERFTADLSDPGRTTLNLVLGQSGNPASPWYMDQLDDWLRGATHPLPFTPAAIQPATTHTLVLQPQ